MKSKAHSKKCQEMGVLVSSLVDLEAEEGKIFHVINLLLLLREGNTHSGRKHAPQIIFSKMWSSFLHPRLLPAPKRGFLLAWDGLRGHPGSLHPWDSL